MTTRPPPRITFDERGLLLHMTTSKGESVTVPLEPETAFRFAAALQGAVAKLKTDDGKQLIKSAAVSLWQALTKGDDDQ